MATSSQATPRWRWSRRFLQEEEEPECGTLVERKLQMTTGCEGNYCERSYLVLLPCTEEEVVPLLFSVHCFGCTARTMEHWSKQATDYGFGLVIPQGIKSSFNAKVCCGEAMHQNVDDKAFFKEIQTQLVLDSRPSISSQAVYAVGWSNGGYMVTYAAELFRAIAPISGYQYDDLQQLSPHHPVGLFLHQAADDPNVQATGCCTDSSLPHCCCGISEASPDTCLSATGFVEEFGETINGCAPDSWQELVVDGIACQTSTACQRNTTFCIHPHGQHFNRPSHEMAFPMRGAIMDFFARDACQISGSDWDADTLKCSCSGGGGGRYCLSSGGNVDDTQDSQSTSPMSSSNASQEWLQAPLAIALLLSTLALVGFQRYKSSRDKYAGFQVAPTVELSSVEEKAI